LSYGAFAGNLGAMNFVNDFFSLDFSRAALPPGMRVFTQGFGLGLGLIVAIGAQNAFVLRQGLRREWVGSVVLFCALADALLMGCGVLGLGQLIGSRPALTQALALAGAAFLLVYGWRAWQRAHGATQDTQALQAGPVRTGLRRVDALAQVAAFTLLNPHVYLDTVLLVGGIGAQHAPAVRPWFVAGAASASVCWFSALGYGARWLAPWFSRPQAWKLLDSLIAVTMVGIAVTLVFQVLAGSGINVRF
jgi:L-lysine exporter family protein LysE/ArgO